MSLLESLKKLHQENSKNDEKNKKSYVSDISDLSYGALYDVIDKLVSEKRKMEAENDVLRARLSQEKTVLEKKISDFIDWYRNENIEEFKSQTTIDFFADNLEKLIDKVAIWYELKYPDYEINRIIPCAWQEETEINDVMFRNNSYIESLFASSSDVRLLDWSGLNNWDAFVNSLKGSERAFFNEPRYYRDIVYFDKNKPAHFHIDSNGTILEADNMEIFNKDCFNNIELTGKNIREVLYLLQENEISIPKDSELLKEVKKFDSRVYLKNELFDCIMYRIIERGGNRFGPRRAYVFAQEFGRDIDIPLRYGIDMNDPGLENFISEYLIAGGREDLICLKNYFYKKQKEEDYEEISIFDLCKKYNNGENVKQKIKM